MSSVQQAARYQQKIEELCGAAVRALSGQTDLYFRGRNLHKGLARFPLHAAHLQIDPDTDDFASYRGVSDGIALRLQHTDEALHSELCPEEPVERLIFELLEQLRVESLVPRHLTGMSHNLSYRFKQWSLQFHHSGLSDSGLGILLYTVTQMSWARLNSCQVLEQTEDFIEATRAGIAPIIGTDLARLKKHRHDQVVYAEYVKSIAKTIHQLIQHAQIERGEDDANDSDMEDEAIFQLLMNFDETEDTGVASALSGQSKVFVEAESGYRIFTTKYDKEVQIASLIRPELLKELREQLDEKVLAQGINITRLARLLSVLFAVPERDGWSFGEEEGMIDGRRLSQLVSSPTSRMEHRLFQQEKYNPQSNAMVTFLIDCSGSMKQHIDDVAVLIDSFGRALELANVSTEILGFTTGGWNGGKAMRDWMSQGRPKYPGRLNELCYMVYKDADSSWRRARPNIAAMLKPDLFREGIDGESVDWACQRMTNRDALRKVLFVISDGCPMDTATNLANDQFYLDNHLKEVVERHEILEDVEIYGLGVGLDLSPYYPHSHAMDLSEGLNNHVFVEIFRLLSGVPAKYVR